MKRIVLSLAALLLLATPALAAGKRLPPPVWRDADAENTLVIDDFMAQTGDPANTGQGGSTLPNVDGEFSFKRAPGDDLAVIAHPDGHDAGFIGALPVLSQPAAMAVLMADGRVSAYPTFCQGVIGMARADDPNSANSQFFLMRQPHTSLDSHYTAFGRVIVGEDVVRAIKTGEPVPAPQDRMQRVQVLADMPDGVRPAVKVVDTKSAYFAALVAKARADAGDRFTLCDVDVAGQAK
jgi:peptidylprolyl isomerase